MSPVRIAGGATARTPLDGSGIPEERVVLTLPGPDDRVALIGLAGGVSLGVVPAEL